MRAVYKLGCIDRLEPRSFFFNGEGSFVPDPVAEAWKTSFSTLRARYGGLAFPVSAVGALIIPYRGAETAL
ncbi:hypothetical protein MRX96_013061 [Rhipicephalus microplus]